MRRPNSTGSSTCCGLTRPTRASYETRCPLATRRLRVASGSANVANRQRQGGELHVQVHPPVGRPRDCHLRLGLARGRQGVGTVTIASCAAAPSESRGGGATIGG